MDRSSLSALQSFILVARTGNLSRAAEQLHVTASALSHQIRGLEQRIDRRLFQRGPRGVKLTSEGEQLLNSVAAPFDTIETALQRYRTRSDETLTLSVMPSVASSWLVPRLPAFVALYPEVQLSLQSTTNLVDFDRESVDAALRFGRGQWPGLRANHLFDEWITPVASPILLKKRGRPKMAELAHWPLLGDPGNRWTDWFKQTGDTPPQRFVATFNDSETLHKAAVEGMGIALGRMTMARPLIEAGRLVALTNKRLLAEFAHYLVYPVRSEKHPALTVFRDWLLAEAKTYTTLLNQPFSRKIYRSR